MVMTDTALALIGISVVTSLLLLVATIYYVPAILEIEEDEEGNSSRTGGHGV